MPLSTEERSLRASYARSRNARRRRFQRYLKEMRDYGLDVVVWTAADANGQQKLHPDYVVHVPA
jgi:hypothetical protein